MTYAGDLQKQLVIPISLDVIASPLRILYSMQTGFLIQTVSPLIPGADLSVPLPSKHPFFHTWPGSAVPESRLLPARMTCHGLGFGLGGTF